jgi:mono/diheme cytochrome c family protein
VAEGEAIYGAECAACHGANLEGQADWQVRLENGRLPAPPHDRTGHTWHHPDQILVAITALGTAALVGGDYESDMNGFSDRLSEAQIIAVLSYIKSTWPEDVIEIHNEINARAAQQ